MSRADRQHSRFDCDLNVADIAPDLTTTSPPRRVVTMPIISGPVWGPDGKSLMFAGNPEGGVLYLWKLDADRLGSPERIESAGPNVGEQVAVAKGGRLAFSRLEDDREIVRIAIGQPPVTLISSSSSEAQATYSEDGRRIAFSSDRSGTTAVWVAEPSASATHTAIVPERSEVKAMRGRLRSRPPALRLKTTKSA